MALPTGPGRCPCGLAACPSNAAPASAAAHGAGPHPLPRQRTASPPPAEQRRLVAELLAAAPELRGEVTAEFFTESPRAPPAAGNRGPHEGDAEQRAAARAADLLRAAQWRTDKALRLHRNLAKHRRRRRSVPMEQPPPAGGGDTPEAGDGGFVSEVASVWRSCGDWLGEQVTAVFAPSLLNCRASEAVPDDWAFDPAEGLHRRQAADEARRSAT
eukprot:TRINITY_DN72161_c0_g1_i1.p1 TRINITY_DN72161_c0_g1~~TRINITY_DN72161_c0_g1_i1.p1  ORF type:complete len:215 (+),score=49.45 TRINITY_DN72161_c0_g1_i1:104-748(+)